MKQYRVAPVVRKKFFLFGEPLIRYNLILITELKFEEVCQYDMTTHEYIRKDISLIGRFKTEESAIEIKNKLERYS